MKTQESIYKQCAAAIDRLTEDPRAVFTEIDVQIEAADGSWGEAEYRKALHDSNEVCGQRFRNRKLCRYGPVTIGQGKTKVEDYARIAGKIVYADAVKGPKVWRTPNGSFEKMMIQDDNISRQGRNRAADRNDQEPWSNQALPTKPRKARSSAPPRTNKDLTRLVGDLFERVQALEDEREHREALITEQAKQQRQAASSV